MNELIAQLTAFSAAIAARQVHRFEAFVKRAYEAGARREELLMTVDSARGLVPLPEPVVDRAFSTVHACSWMEGRRVWRERALAPVAA